MTATDVELTALYRQHLTLVRGRALRILANTAAADDVVQEVFMRYVQRRRQQSAADENTAAFLYQMATRCSLNVLRGRGRRQKYEYKAQQSGITAAAHDEQVLVRDLLMRVPEEEAILAAYYYFDGLEHEEIAELMGMPRRQVGRRLADFRARARRILEQPAWEGRYATGG